MSPNRKPPRRTPPPPSGGANRALWIMGGVVVVVGIALIVAIVAGRSSSSSSSPSSSPTGTAGPGGEAAPSGGTVVVNGTHETGTVTVTGDALPAADSSSSDPAVGQIAPGLAGENFAGQPISITNDGKPKVVLFVAHWCPHCQREVPLVQGWLDQDGMPDGVSLYSVATATTSSRDNYPPSNWLVSQGWSVPVLVDDDSGTAAQAWGLSSYPYFVAVGADGKVVARGSGELTKDQFDALVEAARTGTAQG